MMKVSIFSFTAILWFSGPSLYSAEPVPAEYCATVVTVGEAPATAVSRLAWEKSKMEVSSRFGQTLVRTSYRFANIGNAPVSIVDITPSCGCVATQVNKLDFAPGESGEMKVTLDLAMDDAVGTQERSILVTTSDAPKTPTILHLLVRVPTALETSTKALSWALGEKLETKEVTVSAGPNVADINLIKASENGDFSVDIDPEVSGRSYCVRITPKTTSGPCYAQIRLEAQSSSFISPITCKINATVR